MYFERFAKHCTLTLTQTHTHKHSLTHIHTDTHTHSVQVAYNYNALCENFSLSSLISRLTDWLARSLSLSFDFSAQRRRRHCRRRRYGRRCRATENPKRASERPAKAQMLTSASAFWTAALSVLLAKAA